MLTTKDIGKIGENAATKFLKKNGYKILDRNVHQSHNELDIIALNKRVGVLTFVEVKSRCVNDDLYSKFGTPSSAVTYSKKQRTLAAAAAYLSSNIKYKKYQPRLDVIEVYLNKEDLSLIKINHIENAFGA